MVVSCFVCKNNKKANPGFGYFSFPKDEKLCALWFEAINLPRLPTHTSMFCHQNLRVCSRHFQEKNISLNKIRKRLHPDAVPDLNLGVCHIEILEATACQSSTGGEILQETIPDPSTSGEITSITIAVGDHDIVEVKPPQPSTSDVEVVPELSTSPIRQAHTELNFSLKRHPFTAESITVKREPEDFDNRKTENEVYQDLDQKSTIQIHSHIKSEEEEVGYINSEYLISHEEVNIKPEEDVEQAADTQIEKDGLGQSNSRVVAHSARPNKAIEPNKCNNRGDKKACKPHLKNYMILPCPDGAKMYKCSGCSYKTPQEGRFKNHKVTCHIYKPNNRIIHKCPDCPYQTKYKCSIKKHSIRHKNPDEIVWHRCTECPYKTNRKGGLKQHSIRHKIPDEIVWHRCTECPFKSSRKCNLKNHTAVHNEMRQFEIFKCAHCVYETPLLLQLKQHLLRH